MPNDFSNSCPEGPTVPNQIPDCLPYRDSSLVDHLMETFGEIRIIMDCINSMLSNVIVHGHHAGLTSQTAGDRISSGTFALLFCTSDSDITCRLQSSSFAKVNKARSPELKCYYFIRSSQCFVTNRAIQWS
jgi:hypothetical protein